MHIYAAHLCCAFCGIDSLFLQSTIEYPLHYGPLKKTFVLSVLSLTFSFWPGLQSAHRNPHCRTQLQIRLLHSLPLLGKSRNMILQHPGHQKEPWMENSVLWHCCDTSRLTVPPQTESYWIVLFSIYNSIPFYTSKRFGHVSMHKIHYEPHPEAFKLSGQYWDHPWSGLRLQKPEDARRQIVQSSSKIFKLFEKNRKKSKEKRRKFPHFQSSQAMMRPSIPSTPVLGDRCLFISFSALDVAVSPLVEAGGTRKRRNWLEKVIADQQAGTRADGAAEVHFSNFAMLHDRQQQRYLWQDVTWRFSQVSCKRKVVWNTVDALAGGFACLRFLRTLKVV